MENRIRVVIADRHPLVRAGLRLLIEGDAGLAVVAEADCACAAVAAVLDDHPDILLLDSHLPDGQGVDLVRAVRRDCPRVRILALITFPDEVLTAALLAAGAEACLSKCADSDAFLAALKAVVVGCTPPEEMTRSRSNHSRVLMT